MLRVLAVMLVWIMLSACGGGGGGTASSASGGVGSAAGAGDRPVRPPFVLPDVAPPDARMARLDAYEAQKIRVLGGSGSGFAGLAPTTAVPVQGNQRFTGFASLRIESAPVLTLFGDVVLNAGYATGTLTGSATGFFGSAPTGGLADYAGTLAVSGPVAADLQLGYAGTLTGAGQQIAVSGTLAGGFLGDPVRALQALDLDTQVTRNGTGQSATMLVVAETAPP